MAAVRQLVCAVQVVVGFPGGLSPSPPTPFPRSGGEGRIDSFQLSVRTTLAVIFAASRDLPRSACEGGNLCFELFMNSGVSAFLQRDGDGAGAGKGTDKQNSPVHLSRGTGLWRNSAMLRAGHFAMTRAISRTLLE